MPFGSWPLLVTCSMVSHDFSSWHILFRKETSYSLGLSHPGRPMELLSRVLPHDSPLHLDKPRQNFRGLRHFW
jgi:hypothetical protein